MYDVIDREDNMIDLMYDVIDREDNMTDLMYDVIDREDNMTDEAPPPLPYAVKASRVVWMIQNHPPPMPLCFDSLKQWQAYLMYLDASGERITRRQDTGKWTTRDGAKVRTVRTVVTVFDRIPFCDDCGIGEAHQLRMAAEKRCILPQGT